jgi:hypothetical protein
MLIVVTNLFCDEARPVAIAKKWKLEDLLRWDLGQLLEVAKDATLLPEKLNLNLKMDLRAVKDPVPTDRIREVRNLVHPGRYLRERGGKEITRQELDTLYATCHAAYLCLVEKIEEKSPHLPKVRTILRDPHKPSETGGSCYDHDAKPAWTRNGHWRILFKSTDPDEKGAIYR